VAYLREVRSILVYLGICDGNMEEGSFRCDANVSIRPKGQEKLGTRAELKNMNSFRHVQKAIEYEIERQADCLEDGVAIVQETRLYNAEKNITASMRGKEEANDYRYFPDPDLVPLKLAQAQLTAWRETLPELPRAKRERFMNAYSLPANDAATLTAERDLADYFEAAAAAYHQPKKLANWILSEFLREANEAKLTAGQAKLKPADMAKLVKLVEDGTISGKIGKQIFPELFASGGDPEGLVKAKGLVQISDASSLEAVIDKIIADNPAEAEAFRGGKTKLMGFFVGQVMRATKGQANPGLVNDLIKAKLG
jgi:aspartyl-tRNA(Asn)/glutamyl-tRNA(Gln) amidotransferase subunit B